MVFKDVTPVMILGEAREIAPGKIIVHVSVSEPLPLSSVADLAVVALGADRKSVGSGSVVCRTHPVSADRSMRLLVDAVSARDESLGQPVWYGCIFEISTFRLPGDVEAVALVADDLDGLSGELVVTVEDGHSNPHVFPVKFTKKDRSSVLTTVYRHASAWKVRAAGLTFKADRTAIAAQLGMKEAWPKAFPAKVPAGELLARGGPQSDDTGKLRQPTPTVVSPPSKNAPPSRSVTTGQETAPPPLDLARLSALERDTAAVSRLLSDIFTDTGSPAPKIEAKSGPAQLDDSHAEMLRNMMIERSVTPSDFERLARENGLMASGAEATINDWSFDVVGDVAIISDGETFTFNEDVRRSIENLG